MKIIKKSLGTLRLLSILLLLVFAVGLSSPLFAGPGASKPKVSYTLKTLTEQGQRTLQGEIAQGMVVLNEEEQNAIKIVVKKGKIYLGTSNTPYSSGRYQDIYVMRQDGEIFIYNERNVDMTIDTREYFIHPSFLGGQPVAGAGEITVNAGLVTYLSNGSGHYRPDETVLCQVVKELLRKGVSNSFTICNVDTKKVIQCL